MSWAGRAATSALVAAITFAPLAGCEQNCVRGGPSFVELRLPSSSWELSNFCVDTECVPVSELQPPDAADEGPRVTFYSYVVEVGDTPRTYRYRVEFTTPGGTPLTREGDVRTTGNKYGGERCNPVTARATLIVDDHGEVTVQAHNCR